MSSNSTSFQSGTQKTDYQKLRHFDDNMIKDTYTCIMQNKRIAIARVTSGELLSLFYSKQPPFKINWKFRRLCKALHRLSLSYYQGYLEQKNPKLIPLKTHDHFVKSQL